jgi:hypothetical protein
MNLDFGQNITFANNVDEIKKGIAFYLSYGIN